MLKTEAEVRSATEGKLVQWIIRIENEVANGTVEDVEAAQSHADWIKAVKRERFPRKPRRPIPSRFTRN